MAVPRFDPEPYHTPTAAAVDDSVFLRYPEFGMIAEIRAEDGSVYTVHDGDGWKGPFETIGLAEEFRKSLQL